MRAALTSSSDSARQARRLILTWSKGRAVQEDRSTSEYFVTSVA